MRVFRSFGVALLAATLTVSATGSAQSGRSEQARAELEALRDRIDAVRQHIAADKSQRGDLANALNQAEADISAAQKRLRTLDDAIAAHRDRIDSRTARRDAERDDLGDKLDVLRDQVRAAYSSGRMNRMRLLLSGESPEKLGRMLVYFEYFAGAQTEQVHALQDTLADLAVRQRALEQEQDALAERRADRAETLSRLEANQAERREAIAALDSQLSSRQANLENLRIDAQRLEDLLGSLQSELSALPPVDEGTPFAELKGRMRPPVDGRVLARFGTTKAGGPLKWQGQWRAAPEGTAVRAVAGGRVVYVGYMHRYGLIVILDHGNKYYTLYGHAESTYVEVGDNVQRGQAVAKAGRSGGHRRSGAYFEIRRGSTPVNPSHWLSG